jgi:hypothetical protein
MIDIHRLPEDLRKLAVFLMLEALLGGKVNPQRPSQLPPDARPARVCFPSG